MSASLRHYAAAGYAAVCVETVEEERLLTALLAGLADPPGITRSNILLASASGIYDARTRERIGTPSFAEAFRMTASRPESVLLATDFQHVARNPGAYRALRDALPDLRANGSMAILAAPSWSLPPELESEIGKLAWALPTRSELSAALASIADSAGLAFDGSNAATLLDSLTGLPLSQAEGIAALAVAETGGFDSAIMRREKLASLKATGYMEAWEPEPLSSLGGLGELKRWATEELLPSIHDPELAVRGVFFSGITGTGKTLAAKVLAAVLGWPAIRGNISMCKGSLVGQTEQRIADLLARAVALSPCVLIFDEVEKAVNTTASQSIDGGASSGIEGAILTFLAEHKSPIVTVATCNDFSRLSDEFTRPGRFDKRFFVDLPIPGEREEIATIHLARYGCDPDGHAARIVELTEGWTGAEIEALIKSAARRTNRAITADALAAAAKDGRPLSRSKAREIEALRSWAKDALVMANDVSTAPATTRRIARGH